MDLTFDAVYYEPQALEYPLGKAMREKYRTLPWVEITSHNRIPELSAAENKAFAQLKRHWSWGSARPTNIPKTTRCRTGWCRIPLPAAGPCAYTVIWSATTISAPICACL